MLCGSQDKIIEGMVAPTLLTGALMLNPELSYKLSNYPEVTVL